MKIDKKRDDFSNSKKVTLHVGCCCCCCFFWPGGIVGGILGIIPTQQALSSFKEDPIKKAALTTARKWFWFTFLTLSLGTGLLFFAYEYGFITNVRNSFQIVFWTSVVGFPALHLLIAAIITAVAINSRVPDQEVRKTLNFRNIYIVIGSTIGYALGWAVIFGGF